MSSSVPDGVAHGASQLEANSQGCSLGLSLIKEDRRPRRPRPARPAHSTTVRAAAYPLSGHRRNKRLPSSPIDLLLRFYFLQHSFNGPALHQGVDFVPRLPNRPAALNKGRLPIERRASTRAPRRPTHEPPTAFPQTPAVSAFGLRALQASISTRAPTAQHRNQPKSSKLLSPQPSVHSASLITQLAPPHLQQPLFCFLCTLCTHLSRSSSAPISKSAVSLLVSHSHSSSTAKTPAAELHLASFLSCST